jgi:hypothetical protein
MHANYTAADCLPYYREQLVTQLRRVLPTSAAVEQALEALDYGHFITDLPLRDIAEPFVQLILAGGKLHAELLAYNLEQARKHRMTWAEYVQEHLLPYVLAGVPLPGAPARSGLAPYRPDVHVLALRVVDRSNSGPMSMVYSSAEARSHSQLIAGYDQEQHAQLLGTWAQLERKETLELTYGVLPRRLLLGAQVLTDDFLETVKVA